jgi:hypothetical protein
MRSAAQIVIPCQSFFDPRAAMDLIDAFGAQKLGQRK